MVKLALLARSFHLHYNTFITYNLYSRANTGSNIPSRRSAGWPGKSRTCEGGKASQSKEGEAVKLSLGAFGLYVAVELA